MFAYRYLKEVNLGKMKLFLHVSDFSVLIWGDRMTGRKPSYRHYLPVLRGGRPSLAGTGMLGGRWPRGGG